MFTMHRPNNEEFDFVGHDQFTAFEFFDCELVVSVSKCSWQSLTSGKEGVSTFK
jgi:hypothetical protein